MTQLRDADFNVELTGFTGDDLDAALQEAMGGSGVGAGDLNQELAKPERATLKRGDIWLLGPHRLMCGDSTNGENVFALFGGAKPNLMATDPPYGVDYDAEWRKDALDQNVASGKVNNDPRADWREAWALFPGDVAYVWHAGTQAHVVGNSLVAAGFEIRAQIIWMKQRFVISRGNYHFQHEPAYYAVRASYCSHVV